MKIKFLIAFIILFVFKSFAQDDTTRYTEYNDYGRKVSRAWIKGVLHLPDTAKAIKAKGNFAQNSQGTALYIHNGTNWQGVAGSVGTPVDTAAIYTILRSKADSADLNKKVDKTTTINGKPLNQNINLGKADIGLANVDNTSDLNKPISTATQVALATKAPSDSITALRNDLTNKASKDSLTATNNRIGAKADTSSVKLKADKATTLQVGSGTSSQDLSQNRIFLNQVPNTDATNPNNTQQDPTHRYSTDVEKTYWNGKEDGYSTVLFDSTINIDVKKISAPFQQTGKIHYVKGNVTMKLGADWYQTIMPNVNADSIVFNTTDFVIEDDKYPQVGKINDIHFQYLADGKIHVWVSTINANYSNLIRSRFPGQSGFTTYPDTEYQTLYFNNPTSSQILFSMGTSDGATDIVMPYLIPANTNNIPIDISYPANGAISIYMSNVCEACTWRITKVTP